MISITINGLDQFVVGRLSRELTPSLAKLYQVDEGEINFIAPNTMVFHNGVEQTSWNIYIEVLAPRKYEEMQEEAADYLLESIGDLAINKTLTFVYYESDARYQKLNNEYPRYIASDNLVDIDDEYDEEMEEGDGEDQIYTGDIFQDFDPNKFNK